MNISPCFALRVSSGMFKECLVMYTLWGQGKHSRPWDWLAQCLEDQSLTIFKFFTSFQLVHAKYTLLSFNCIFPEVAEDLGCPWKEL